MIVNNELETIWKEGIHLDGVGKLRKTAQRIVGAPAKIRTDNLQNTNHNVTG
jgi:hypothetical protein